MIRMRGLLIACLAMPAFAVAGTIPTGLTNPLPAAATPDDGPAANRAAAPAWTACAKTLDGITTHLGRTQRTVTVVNQTSKTRARVSFWVRTDGACSVQRMFLTTTARIGYNGTVAGKRRKQGSGTTPRGRYTMTEAFGNGTAPATSMPYHRVAKGDYWVGDNKSDYYNSLRNKADGGFRWRLPSSSANASENLRAFGKQYRYVAVINFNRAPDVKKQYRGYGIFLHVKGSGATAGCVGVTRSQMRTVLAYLQPGDTIKIAR